MPKSKSDDNEVWSNLPHMSDTRKGPPRRMGPAKVRAENAAKPADDLTPWENLPHKNNGKVKKYGIGGFIKRFSPMGMNPATVLNKRPLTFKTLLDPAGILTDDNLSQDYKKKMEAKKSGEGRMRNGGAVKSYKSGGSVRGCGCAAKGKNFKMR